MQYITLRNPKTNQAISVWAPDRASAQAALHQRFPNGVPANLDIGPVGGPNDMQGPPPHQGEDWSRLLPASGLRMFNGGMSAAGGFQNLLGAAEDWGARQAENVGLLPHGSNAAIRNAGMTPHQLFDMVTDPVGSAERMSRQAVVQHAAHSMGANPKLAHAVASAVTAPAPGPAVPAWTPQNLREGEEGLAEQLFGQHGARQFRDTADYQPHTLGGRVADTAIQFAPAAAFPASATQRVFAVAAPTLGATLGGEGARYFKASPETVSDAELLGSLLAAGAGSKAVAPIESAAAGISDLATGRRPIPTSGSAGDLVAMLRGTYGGPTGPEALTYRKSDLQGAANILAQHVGRVTRAGGEDFDTMAGRLGGFGDQGMLADALPDLGRQVADRGSFGQQFLGKQLYERQLGVRDPVTGAWTAPSQSMRLRDAYAQALGIPDGVATFDYLKGIEEARNAAAAENYRRANARPSVPASTFSDYAASPVWNDAYARARQISDVEPVPNPDGTFSIQQLPATMPEDLDWRTLDLMKRGLGDMVDAAPAKGLGATYGGALDQYLGRLTEAQGQLNPDLLQARADYAAPSQLMDAADLGSTFRQPNVSAAEVAWHLGQSDPHQVIGLRVGHYNSAQPVFDGSARFNAAERLGATSPGAFDKDNLLIGDPDVAANWQQLLGNEGTFFNTKNRVLGGSLTSRNELGAEDAADIEGVNAADLAAGLVRAKAGDLDGIVETGANAGKLLGLGKLFQPKPSQMTEGTADVLGTILGTRGAFMDPQTAALVQEMMDRAKAPHFNFGVARPAAVLGAPQSNDQGGPNAP